MAIEFLDTDDSYWHYPEIHFLLVYSETVFFETVIE